LTTDNDTNRIGDTMCKQQKGKTKNITVKLFADGVFRLV